MTLSKWLDISQSLSSPRTKIFAANDDNGYHLLSKLPLPVSVLRIEHLSLRVSLTRPHDIDPVIFILLTRKLKLRNIKPFA